MSQVMSMQMQKAGIGGLVDGAVDQIDAASFLKGAAKLGLGLMSGDYLSAIQGGMQLLGAILQLNPPFETEYACAPGTSTKGPAGYAAPGPAKGRERSAAEDPRDVGASACAGPSPAGGSRSLAADLAEYQRTLEVLQRHHGTFAGRLERDLFISTDELRAIAEGPNTAPELKRAAQFLLDHPEYMGRLLSAGPHLFGWEKDNKFGHPELRNELEWVRQERRHQPLESGPPPVVKAPPPPPVTTAPVPGPGGDEAGCGPIAPAPPRDRCLADVLNDPSLSTEEKLRRIMMLLTERLDDALLEVMGELEAATQRTADVVAKGAGATDAEKAQIKRQETTQQFLQMRLQELMEKRKAMFELMSNLSASFHAMSRAAISNLGRA